MNRSPFGWSLPPGVTHSMIDEAYGFEQPCEVCGGDESTCECPECPVCGVCGDPTCYKLFPPAANYSSTSHHNLVRSEAQRISLEINERLWRDAIEEENRYLSQMEECYEKMSDLPSESRCFDS